MFFYLSKILNFIIHPILWVFVLLLCSLFIRKRSKLFLGLGMLVFVIFSNPLLCNFVMRNWEISAPPKENLPLMEVGIVLTGALSHNPDKEDQMHVGEAGDRFTEAMVLYKQGFIRKILITGGSGSILDPEFKESEALKTFLVTVGFPEEDIIIEANSRNTHENATNTAEVLKAHSIDDRKHLLITSAFHMRRSLACFSKEKIDVVPYSVDFRSTYVEWDVAWVLPSPHAFANWSMLIKEWVGMVAYKVAGYI
ncbi:MAG: YdcF family protein [Cyclobacteriaceae bacterium]|nr:YdcF family protein [Cyclobacteriaceae bacterium SS2]